MAGGLPFVLALRAVLAPACGGPTTRQMEVPTMGFELTSPDFQPGTELPRRHTCDGEDAAVTLRWAGAPAGTAEFALVMDDPDARGFVHWVVVGIPGDASGLTAGELPAGAQEGPNDFGRTGYGGPCPPSGTHRYAFTLYALPKPLAVSSAPTADDVRRAAAHALGEARLTATYTRAR